jgi:hypothetical protein
MKKIVRTKTAARTQARDLSSDQLRQTIGGNDTLQIGALQVDQFVAIGSPSLFSFAF